MYGNETFEGGQSKELVTAEKVSGGETRRIAVARERVVLATLGAERAEQELRKKVSDAKGTGIAMPDDPLKIARGLVAEFGAELERCHAALVVLGERAGEVAEKVEEVTDRVEGVEEEQRRIEARRVREDAQRAAKWPWER